MKNLKYIAIAIGAVTVLSCTKTQFDEFEAVDSGSANFTKYISVGNSLTQGYSDGGLHNEHDQQLNSYPAIIARQMNVDFEQPMVSGAGSGHKFLQDLSPTLIDITAESSWSGSGWSDWDQNKKYNNLGVAGIRLKDCAPTTGSALSPTINQIVTDLNPYGGFLDFGSLLFPKSYLEHVEESNATFFTCWLGNNDVLGWSTAGGDDGEITIAGIGLVKLSDLTPVGEFRQKYDDILGAFQSQGAKGVCATLPNVTSIPFFTTVPHNPIPLDAAKAASLNSGYATYNSTLNALVGTALTAAEAAQRQIVFVEGATNAIVIMDESLTDLTGINAALISMRQATAADFILLTASPDIGRVFSPTQVYGLSVPFADSLVLTQTEVTEVTNHTTMLNSEIRASAAAHGVAVADMHSYMSELQAGLVFDGVSLSAKYIQGGAFSLDGVHPNTRGYALIANKFMETMNSAYGSNLRPVLVQDYKGIIFP